MAISQVITATKAGSEFVSLDEARAQYAVDSANAGLKTYLAEALSGSAFTVDADWDDDTQTMTFTRVWDTDAYNAYIAAKDTDRQSAKTALETAGWTVTESTASV